MDTGNILTIKYHKIGKHEKLRDLQPKLYMDGIELAKDKLIEIHEKGIDPGIPQSNEEGKQYYKMSSRNERTVKHKFLSFQSRLIS